MSDLITPAPVAFDPAIALRKALLAAGTAALAVLLTALGTVSPEQIASWLLAAGFSQKAVLVAVPLLVGAIRFYLNHQKTTSPPKA